MFDGKTKLGLGGLASYKIIAEYMKLPILHYFEVSNYYRNVDYISKVLSKYDRGSYCLTAKFHRCKHVEPMYIDLKTNFIDCLMIHAAGRVSDCDLIPSFEQAKADGRCNYIGVSFHGGTEDLEKILSTYPCIDIVQLECSPVNTPLSYEEKQKQIDLVKQLGKKLIVMGAYRVGLSNGLKIEDMVAHYKYIGAEIILSSPGSSAELTHTLGLLETLEPKQSSIIDASFKCMECNYCTMGCPKEINVCKAYNDIQDGKDPLVVMLKHKLNKCIECGKCTENCPINIDVREAIRSVKTNVRRRVQK